MIYVIGQQDYAERINRYLQEISPQRQWKIFSFPLPESNPEEQSFDFTPYAQELERLKKTVPIIIAFRARYQQDVFQYLKLRGFADIRFFDATMDNKLKKSFFKKIFAVEGREFSLVADEKTVLVYMAKSEVDKPVKNSSIDLSPHIIPIQVGAALTNKRIASLADNTGDNISERNRHYSETTALYWIWKNAEADYLGLCHYRRLWKDLERIAVHLQNDIIDVVLPLPTWMAPSVTEGHLKHYTPEVWETMMDVLKRHSSEYYIAAKKIYNGNIFYASNMLIAKRHVLHQLCSWMFPIVMEVEAQVGDLPNKYYNRYCGFCTEQLITLYFLYNKQNYRISHAEKIFIE